MIPMRLDFAHRLRNRDLLIGTFIKSRDPAHVEILGLAGYDFVILDAEHGAFDRADMLAMATASRAARLPLIVRVPVTTGGWIGSALDAGAAGIVVPRISDAALARDAAIAARYGLNGRGFSPSVPGADYGTRGIAGHLERAQEETVLICQIEDPTAVANAGAIAAVEGVDALLLGPVDLTVSMGQTDPATDGVVNLCQQTLTASVAAQTACGLFLGDPSQSTFWQGQGANLFVLGSDQSFLARAARDAIAQLRRGV